MPFEHRWYQAEAIDTICEDLVAKSGNPLCAMPTGTGKSIVIAEVAKRFAVRYPAMRIVMLTHNKELVAQNAEKLTTIWPEAPIGIYSQGLKSKDAEARVIFGTVQSFAAQMRKGKNPFGVRHLVIVDEAHMIAPGERTNYRVVLDAWRAAFPAMRVLGLTATPYRMKGGLLTEGDDRMFDRIVYDLSSMENFNRLLDEGYLAPLVAIKPDAEIDISGIRIQAGDFNQGDVQEAIARQGVIERAVTEMVRRGADRQSWLIFAAGVDAAEQIERLLHQHGINAGVVHSRLPGEVNDEIISDFKSGRIRALVNANMLTTGFDAPHVDLIGMLRPTASTALWVQMLGRGTRPCDGKLNCLVLDFAGNTARLGPINNPVIPKRSKGGNGEPPPAKVCPVCFTYNHTSARNCATCGFEFPVYEKLDDRPSDLALIARPEDVEEKLELHAPRHVLYSTHKKSEDAPACLVVEYLCGAMAVREYVPWEHGGRAAMVADRWWQARFGKMPRPPMVTDALNLFRSGIEIPKPMAIEVDVNSQYKGRVKPKLKREIWK